MSGHEDEELAVVIGSAGRLGHVYIDGNDGCLAVAAAILASDWLAARDARVAATARAEGGRAALLQAANDTTTNGPKVELYVPIHESIALWLRDRAAALRAATEDPS